MFQHSIDSWLSPALSYKQPQGQFHILTAHRSAHPLNKMADISANSLYINRLVFQQSIDSWFSPALSYKQPQGQFHILTAHRSAHPLNKMADISANSLYINRLVFQQSIDSWFSPALSYKQPQGQFHILTAHISARPLNKMATYSLLATTLRYNGQLAFTSFILQTTLRQML